MVILTVAFKPTVSEATSIKNRKEKKNNRNEEQKGETEKILLRSAFRLRLGGLRVTVSLRVTGNDRNQEVGCVMFGYYSSSYVRGIVRFFKKSPTSCLQPSRGAANHFSHPVTPG